MNKSLYSSLFSFLSLIALLSYFSSTAFSQDKAKQIEELLNLYHDVGLFDGVALVSEGEKIIHQKAYGFMDRETRGLNTVKTRFRLGGASKTLTALVILKLAEQGKIDIDQPVQQYFPNTKNQVLEQITTHNLLTHTSGLVDYLDNKSFWEDIAPNKTKRSTILALILDNKLEFKPGSKYKYSNSGFYLLAMMVERVTELSFEGALKELVLEPAGMKNTGVEYGDQKSFNIANGYNNNILDPDFYMPNFMGSNQLYSTANDLYLLDKAIRNNSIISKEYTDIMTKPYLNHYACGIGVLKVPRGNASSEKMDVLTHTGILSGFSAKFFNILNDKSTIILLSNNASTSTTKINNLIVKILNGVPYKLPVLKKRVPRSTNDLKQYVGIYQIDKKVNRIVRLKGNHLVTVRTDAMGQQLELYCENGDAFFYGFNNEVTIKFVRDENGDVVSLVKHQSGKGENATKMK